LLPSHGAVPNRAVELYNLGEDIGERRNLAAAHPDQVARLDHLMREQHSPSAIFPFPALDDPGRE
jgi:hypothetical protein